MNLKPIVAKYSIINTNGLHEFQKKVATFFLTIVVLLIVLIAFARLLSQHGPKLNSSTSLVVCGDSHTQASINDSILSSSINISMGSQPFYYTFAVLEVLLSNNKQVDTVLLGYSFHSLSPYRETMLWGWDNCGYIHLRERYLTIVNLSYIKQLTQKNIAGSVKSLYRSSTQLLWSYIVSHNISDVPYIGRYYSSTGHKLSKERVETAVQRHYYDDAGLIRKSISVYQLSSLYDIAELCNENDVTLYLVNTPISAQYYEAIPKTYIDSYYYIASTVDAILLDFHNIPFPDSCYGDADHLNYYGATEFSLFLDSILNMY